MQPNQSRWMEKAYRSRKATQTLLKENFHDEAATRALFTVYYVVKAMLLSGEEALDFVRNLWDIEQVPLEFEKYAIDDPAWRDDIGYMELSDVTENEALEYIQRADDFLQLGEKFFNPPPPSDEG